MALLLLIGDVIPNIFVDFINAADYAETSLADNIHMDEENHEKLAKSVKIKLREIDASCLVDEKC